MIITDLQDQMGAPTALVMPVELNDERRVDRAVLTDRTVTTAHMVVMVHMVHTVPAALPAGSDRLGESLQHQPRRASVLFLWNPGIPKKPDASACRLICTEAVS